MAEHTQAAVEGEAALSTRELCDFAVRGHVVTVEQATAAELQEACLTADATGIRAYSAAGLALAVLLDRVPPAVELLHTAQRVCELGCGVGALGCAVAVLVRPRLVCLTDGAPACCDAAEANLRRNAIADQADNTDVGGVVGLVRPLPWSRQAAEALLDELGTGGFHVVVGSELLYYHTDCAALIDTVVALLPDGGTFMHCGITRADLTADLMAAINAHPGWRGDVVDLDHFCPMESDPLWEANPTRNLSFLVVSKPPDGPAPCEALTALLAHALPLAEAARGEVEDEEGELIGIGLGL